ncbi:anti-sigma factor antagonist [Streptomyces sp. F001]|uniref:STAS domain-containing protein n=1 Tax=Streptomyces sp. F001 TaxID=1510026 RepID=UPI00101E7743|nr:STAS domain-containing protein [Streptomyces sp. F001]RZB14329.1 anti-sigma factor antagonist [Streptomyces sp. F001]
MPEPSHAGKPYGRGLPWKPGGRLFHWFLRRRSSSTSAPDHVVVRLSGEVTAENAVRIGRRLQKVLRRHPAVLEIDLEGVTYVSSDGGAAFFMALRTARACGARVMVTHVRRQPHGALDQLGLGKILDVQKENGPLGSRGGDQ